MARWLTRSDVRACLALMAVASFSLTWFRGDQLAIGGDWLIPLNPTAVLRTRLYTWMEVNGGREGWLIGYYLTSGFFAFFEKLGLSVYWIERLYVYFGRSLAGIAMYFLATCPAFWRREDKAFVRCVGLAAGFFYMYNPLVIDFTSLYVYLPYSFMPLLLGLFIRGIEHAHLSKRLCYALALTISFGMMGEFPQYKMHIFAAFLMASYGIFSLLFLDVKWRQLRSFAALAVPLGVLLNLWFILPFYSFVFLYSTYNQMTAAANIIWGDLGYATILQSLRLLGGGGFFNSAPYAASYLRNPLLVFLSYLVPIMVFAVLFLRRSRLGRGTAFFSVLALFSIAVSAGPNPPFGQLYKWFVLHVPFMLVFNTSHLLAIGTAMGYSFLLGMIVGVFLGGMVGKSWLVHYGVSGGVLAIVLIASWPLVTGAYLDNAGNPPSFSGPRLPKAYRELNTYLEWKGSDHRTIILPGGEGYMGTEWGYNGGIIYPLTLSVPILFGQGREYGYSFGPEGSTLGVLFDRGHRKGEIRQEFLDLLGVGTIVIDASVKPSVGYSDQYVRTLGLNRIEPVTNFGGFLQLYKNPNPLPHLYAGTSAVLVVGSPDLYIEKGFQGAFQGPTPVFFLGSNLDLATLKRIATGDSASQDTRCRRSEIVFSRAGVTDLGLGDSKCHIVYMFTPGEAVSSKSQTASRAPLLLYAPKNENYIVRARISSNATKNNVHLIPEHTDWNVDRDWWTVVSGERGVASIPLVLLDPHYWRADEHDHRWQWGMNNMRLQVLNLSAQPLQGNMGLRVATIRERDLDVAINGRVATSVHLPANYDKATHPLMHPLRQLITGKKLPPYELRYPPEWTEVRVKNITLKPGANEVVLSTPQGPHRMDDLLGNGDTRQVSIRLEENVSFEIKDFKTGKEGIGTGSVRTGTSGTEEIKKAFNGRLVVPVKFEGDGRAYEYVIIERSFSGGVDLEEYPHFRLSFTVEDPDVQSLETVFGIDYTGDGKVDGYVYALPTLLAGTGEEMEVNLNLFEAAKERFPDPYYKERRNLRLMKLLLVPHKRWSLDLSGQKKGVYRFILGNLEVYNDRSITLPGPQVNLVDAVIRQTGSVDVKSQVEGGQLTLTLLPDKDRWNEGFVEALKGAKGRRRVFILKDGRQVTGRVARIDGGFMQLADVEELEGKDLILYLSEIMGAGDGAVEISIPINGQPWQKYPYLSLEYGAEQPLEQDAEVWLRVRDKKRGAHRLFAGKILVIDRHQFESATVRLDPNRGIRIFEFSLDRALPEAYTTQEGSRGRFVVLKDGQPIDTTWQSWQKGKEQVEIGARGPRSVSLSVPFGDHPLQHRYVVRYLPPEWMTEDPTTKGSRRIDIDLREVLRGIPSELLSVHLLLRGVPREGLTAAEQGELVTFWLRNVAFAKRLPHPAKNTQGLEAELRRLLNQPLVEIDGRPIIFAPPAGQTNLLDRDGYWLEPLKVDLAAGSHNLKIRSHPTFNVDLVEVANKPSEESAIDSQQSARIEFRKINPTRYVVDVEAKKPFWLVFSESFHKGWKGYIRERVGCGVWGAGCDNQREPWSALLSMWKDGGGRIDLKDHFLVNGYANGWYVDIKDVPGAGFRVPGENQKGKEEDTRKFQIVLEFQPQRLFEIGLLISGLTFFGCISYLGYDFVKGHRSGHGPAVNSQASENP